MVVDLARPGPGEFTNAELVAAVAAMVGWEGPARAQDGGGPVAGHAASGPMVPTSVRRLPSQFEGRRLRGVVVLVVDGLGWHQLLDCGVAPFLTSVAADQEPVRAVLPSTTVTNLVSIGTGRHGGDHGLLGYTMVLPDPAGQAAVFNPLVWRFGLRGGGGEARADVVPEALVPRPTMFERLNADGIATTVVVPPDFLDSGLTRAGLRGGQRLGATGLDDSLAAAVGALDGSQAIAYCHHPAVDHEGHRHGPSTPSWRRAVAHVDRTLAAAVATLPDDVAIVVTADHGMVAVPPVDLLEVDDDHPLLRDVVLVAGEPRMRTLVVAPDVDPAAVAERWADVLGERATVATTRDAVAAGWFGPTVPDHHARRLGDVVVASHVGAVAHVRVDPGGGRLAGMHGGMTAAERDIPALLLGGS